MPSPVPLIRIVVWASSSTSFAREKSRILMTPASVLQNVVGLDVAMNETPLVDRVQAPAGFDQHVERERHRQPHALPRHERMDRAAVEPLHQNPEAPIGLGGDILHIDAVLVAESVARSAGREGSMQGAPVRGALKVHQLERVDGMREPLADLVDLAVEPGACEADDLPVLVGVSGLEGRHHGRGPFRVADRAATRGRWRRPPPRARRASRARTPPPWPSASPAEGGRRRRT